jgi:hypothetical protein
MSTGFISLALLNFSPINRDFYGIPDVARPESKGVARKNHKARFIFWAGRASRSFPKNRIFAL